MRKDELDWMKGLGILSVMVAHYFAESTYNIINAFHMPLFFFVAGYLYKPKPWNVSFKKDFSRLIVPYLWVNFAYLLVYALVCYRQSNYEMVVERLEAIFYSSATKKQPSLYLSHVPASGPLWFLTSMYWCKNVYNLFQTKWQYLICFVLGVIATYLHYYLICAPLGFLTGCSAMMFYAMGARAKNTRLFETPNLYVALAGIIFWFVSFHFYPLASCSCTYPNLIVNLLGAFGAIYLLYHLARRFPFKPLEWLGRNSLTILCVHSFFFFTRKYLSAKIVGWDNLFYFDLVMSIVFILAVDWCKKMISAKRELARSRSENDTSKIEG